MASRAHSSHRHDIVDRNSSEDEHADFSNGSSDDYHPSSDSDITESDEKNTRGQEEPQDKKRKSDPKKWKKIFASKKGQLVKNISILQVLSYTLNLLMTIPAIAK
ncbi:uncharacterized protein [Diabrotica undecimpunctata]|uniref:uncharacterized protein n=1 Tax=Diabrotica undecimpunctata TaxID=50387 RepID=UPI003B63FB2F